MTQTKDETQVETGSLQDFEFDDDQEFFGIKPKSSTATDVIKEIKSSTTKSEEDDDDLETTDLKDKKEKEAEATAKEKEKSKGKGKDGEDEPEPKFFEEGKDNPKDDEEDDTKDKDKGKDKDKDKDENDDKFFTTLAGELKEKGIFSNIEIKEGEEITEDKFFELQDAEIEARVNETFEAFFEELDEDGKAFLKFKKDGGKTADFIATFSNDLDIQELDVENKDDVTKVLVHYLTSVEGLDADELKDRMEFLKEGGKEKAYAAKYFKTMEADKIKQQEIVSKAAAKAAEKRAADAEKFNDDIVKLVAKTENVGDFVLSKEDQKSLPSYITKPTVKVGKNKYVPQFQSEVAKIFRAETDEDKQKLLVIAKLVKGGFDISDTVIKKKTEIVTKTKSKLQDAKNNPRATSSGNNSKKSLGDFFSE